MYLPSMGACIIATMGLYRAPRALRHPFLVILLATAGSRYATDRQRLRCLTRRVWLVGWLVVLALDTVWDVVATGHGHGTTTGVMR